MKHLDCTLRDGGYYNDWNFSEDLVHEYLLAMDALEVDYVEIGFRSLINKGFKGPYAFSKEDFLGSIELPRDMESKLGVMINGAEVSDPQTQTERLSQLFVPQCDSRISLVRIACHVHEFEACLPASSWLKDRGYLVGFNLMQVANLPLDEVTELAKQASEYPIDVLYFADSMGSLDPERTCEIVNALQLGWEGDLGIHTHDNMNQAVANSLAAMKAGVAWVDSTVTGMGRGPGNAQTEFLAVANEDGLQSRGDTTKLFELIRCHFRPMQIHYGWGTNAYYYLAGKYGIHPSYIQEMLQDARYGEADIIAVLGYLRAEGGRAFNLNTLEAARHFYSGEQGGTWAPEMILAGRDVLIVGTGPGTKTHKRAIESYIQTNQPYVIALNTESSLDQGLVDARAACHPTRLLADLHYYETLRQPLITPYSRLPLDLQKKLAVEQVYDFGLQVDKDKFEFGQFNCVLPNAMVFSYVLAIANSGKAREVLLVGFDGYSADDARSQEMEQVLDLYKSCNGVPISSLTPTRYKIAQRSVYGA